MPAKDPAAVSFRSSASASRSPDLRTRPECDIPNPQKASPVISATCSSMPEGNHARSNARFASCASFSTIRDAPSDRSLVWSMKNRGSGASMKNSYSPGPSSTCRILVSSSPVLLTEHRRPDAPNSLGKPSSDSMYACSSRGRPSDVFSSPGAGGRIMPSSASTDSCRVRTLGRRVLLTDRFPRRRVRAYGSCNRSRRSQTGRTQASGQGGRCGRPRRLRAAQAVWTHVHLISVPRRTGRQTTLGMKI